MCVVLGEQAEHGGGCCRETTVYEPWEKCGAGCWSETKSGKKQPRGFKTSEELQELSGSGESTSTAAL